MSSDGNQTYKANSDNGANDRRATKVPHEVWIGDDGRERQVDDVCETGVEEIDGGDETSHVDGGTRVSNTVGWHIDEQLGETTKGVWNGLPPERDWRHKTVVNTAWVSATVPAARVGLVCLVAEDAVADTSKGGDAETSADTRNWTVVDTSLAERWVKQVVEDWAENNDGQGVEVANDVVWHAVAQIGRAHV